MGGLFREEPSFDQYRLELNPEALIPLLDDRDLRVGYRLEFSDEKMSPPRPVVTISMIQPSAWPWSILIGRWLKWMTPGCRPRAITLNWALRLWIAHRDRRDFRTAWAYGRLVLLW